ncbi:MAG: diguanylate cyclase domain-containing protein [Xenococcaceae cyanobacterium]
MSIQHLNILLVEDNLADAELIKELLEQEKTAKIEITNVNRVKDALKRLVEVDFDVVLLDLSLPDAQGVEGIVQLKQEKPNVPIVVLTMLDDLNTAVKSVRKGAQDYLVKNNLETELLIRSIRYAIERQHTEKILRQRAEREKLMGKMLERIRQSLDLEIILQTTVNEIRQFLQTDRVAIYRCVAEQSGKLIVQSARQRQVNDPKPHQRSGDLVTGCGTIDDVLVSPYCVQAIVDYDRVRSRKDQVCLSDWQESDRELLTLPIWQNQTLEETVNSSPKDVNDSSPQLLNNNTIWGMLIAQKDNISRQWQSWEIDFLQQLATQLAIAIQQSELYAQLRIVNQKLQQLAIQDGLTGLANRRHFEQTLNNEWQRLTREQKPLSLILCDVDHFKNYNDTYGHPAGDACLKTIAKVLTQAGKRPADLVARYGGEEFAIVLPDTNHYGALFVADTIRQDVERLKLPHQKSGTSRYVTLSMGVATKIPNSHQSIADLIEDADRALYQAKAKGRNQVVMLN